ncbi:hypothetical protein NECAME_15851 [Necator americanus]|uniref:Uncharacterized protein n=1 Tax=Necator americanus TaxID=51031 RepID=W2SFK0_NECAM|nr:hypothetical protein NECAME_15851 [Necator americanus]ETN68389.1 hypothetical protein NECAME_15851 [Necator americanus]
MNTVEDEKPTSGKCVAQRMMKYEPRRLVGITMRMVMNKDGKTKNNAHKHLRISIKFPKGFEASVLNKWSTFKAGPRTNFEVGVINIKRINIREQRYFKTFFQSPNANAKTIETALLGVRRDREQLLGRKSSFEDLHYLNVGIKVEVTTSTYATNAYAGEHDPDGNGLL